MLWRHSKDSEHKIEKTLSGGGQIHSFLNGGGVPYMAVYTAGGHECMSVDCQQHPDKEKEIKELEYLWENGWKQIAEGNSKRYGYAW